MLKPENEDVILIVDGDDQLASDDALEKIKNALLIYGSFSGPSGERSPMCQSYSEKVIKNNGFRKAKWHASHLKTFKYKLYKKLRHDDLVIIKNELEKTLKKTLLRGQLESWLKWRYIKFQELLGPSGEYIRRMDDTVLFYPMLEMASDRAIYIHDILYIYSGQHVKGKPMTKENKVIPGDHKNKWYGRLIRQVLRNKKSYKKLDKSF